MCPHYQEMCPQMCPQNRLERGELLRTLIDDQIDDVTMKKKEPERYWNVSGLFMASLTGHAIYHQPIANNGFLF